MAEDDRTDWLDPAVDPRTASPETATTNTPMVDAPAAPSTEKQAEPLPHRPRHRKQ